MNAQRKSWLDKFRWSQWSALACVVGILGLLWFARSTSTRSTQSECVRASLVLQGGRLCLPETGVPFHGVMVEHWESGVLKSRSAVANGLLDGVSEGWYTNGQRQVVEHFQAGVSHGLRTKWFPDGRKESEGMVVEGKHEGWFRRWREDGTLAEEIHLRNGIPEGLSRAYYASGCLKAEARLQAGQVVERTFWEDGQQRLSPDQLSSKEASPL